MSHRHSPLWPDHSKKPPYGAVEIDGGHPLAPTACWLFNNNAGPITELSLDNHAQLVQYAAWLDDSVQSHLINGAASVSPSIALSKLNFGPASFTLLIRYKLSASDTTGVIVCFGAYGASGWYLQLVNGGGLDFNARTAGPSNAESSISAGALTVGQWNHISIVKAATVSIYVNGVAVPPARSDAFGSIVDTNLGFYFGRYSGSTAYSCSGAISDTTIIPRALSASEVRQLYASPYCFLREIKYRSYGFLGAAASGFKPYWVRRPGSHLLTPGMV
jgi:hypothetical protein